MVNTNRLLDWHARGGELEAPAAVAIVGQAPRQWASYSDAEVWVCNGPDFPPKWDVLWQLHGWEHIDRRHVAKDPGLMRQLRTIGTSDADQPGSRLFMPVEGNGAMRAPHAEAYPLELLTEALRGSDRGRYLTGSIPIMVAHAVELGVERITLDGMRFTPHAQDWWAPGEGWMVPCTEYHLGRADARGILVEVNHGSGLFRGDGWVYGFEGPGSV